MMTNTPKGPIIDPGLCRCCGAAKKCRLLSVEYDWMGKKEIYSDMLFDCFGLLMSNLDGEPEERLICANCVVRLRDATSFRFQVLKCEEMLIKSKLFGSEEVSDDKVKIEIKLEAPQSPIYSDRGDDDDYCNDDDNSADDVKSEPRTPRTRSRTLKLAKKSESKRRVVTKMSPSTEVDLKKDMLMKMRKMRAKLNVLKQTGGNKRVQSKDLKEKKGLLLQMREMRTKLAAMRQSMQTERKPSAIKLVRKRISEDKDNNSFWNAVTIVENSYVCPFMSTYSDYFCVYCKEMFTEPEKLREHTMGHDPTTYRDVVNNKKFLQVDIFRVDCRLCQKAIDDIEELKAHLSNEHKKHFHTAVNEELLKFRLKAGSVACLECDRTFGFFHALKKHMAEHFGTFICDMCGVHYFEERLLIQHKKSHKRDAAPSESYACAECGKSFRSKKNRFFHVARIHNNEPAYACNKCDETFLSHYMRYKHKMEVHGETRTFPCESCDRVYTNRKSLREHNRKNHLQLLRYICNHCDKKFYLPSQLKDHMTSHTGERNFRCEYCGKSYPRLRALKVHMQSHNSEKRYKCALCSASYTQLNNFKNHMKSKHQNDGQFT